MNKQPLVSIGIPTYNRPELLKRALDSAINQTYKNLEIIISDNCSENLQVEKLCREYAAKDNRIKYFRQQKNIGMALNGQFVLDNAGAEYYMWCMDDDWLCENYIQESLEFLLNNPDYSIAFGEMNFYDENYNLVQKCTQVSFEEEQAFERILKYCKTAIKSSLSFGFMKTDLMRQVYTVEGRMPEDWIYMIKILFQGKGKFIESISYNALNNGCSKNLESLKKFFNMPNLTEDNFWETLSEIIKNAVLSDDFFLQRLDEKARNELAQDVQQALLSNKLNSSKEEVSLKSILKFMYQHPLFLFRKDFYKKFSCIIK